MKHDVEIALALARAFNEFAFNINNMRDRLNYEQALVLTEVSHAALSVSDHYLEKANEADQ